MTLAASGHQHQHPHAHPHAPQGAPSAEAIAWIDGVPLAPARLRGRIDALRRSSRAGLLPSPGTAEDRQLHRWVAQVLITEALCEQQAEQAGLTLPAPGEAPLAAAAAVELGSIV
ncbi:DUF7158 domain-containing protein, partial [Kitasatospora nipponensis]|uniref:DUF7158 domain-containing protein n=1 Tax=Kitasatospora nipponensis TaxID=258049 RepID=UPI003CD07C3B